MVGPDYIISTHRGCVPHVVDLNSQRCFKKHYLIYTDDFLYPGGYYSASEDVVNINTFIQVPHPVVLMFKGCKRPTKKGKKRALETPRGAYAINEDAYNSFVCAARPSMFSDFYTSKLSLEVKRPSGLKYAVEFLERGCVIDTEFINDLAKQGLVISTDDLRTCVHVADFDFGCPCCDGYNSEYIQYMWDINEIMCMNIIQNHNYFHLYLILDKVKKKDRCSSLN